jgi:hypothetical protein
VQTKSTQNWLNTRKTAKKNAPKMHQKGVKDVYEGVFVRRIRQITQNSTKSTIFDHQKM